MPMTHGFPRATSIANRIFLQRRKPVRTQWVHMVGQPERRTAGRSPATAMDSAGANRTNGAETKTLAAMMAGDRFRGNVAPSVMQ